MKGEKLKTLKDIMVENPKDFRLEEYDDLLREEAIKWIKITRKREISHNETTIIPDVCSNRHCKECFNDGAELWIKHFFNIITEEDIKNV